MNEDSYQVLDNAIKAVERESVSLTVGRIADMTAQCEHVFKKILEYARRKAASALCNGRPIDGENTEVMDIEVFNGDELKIFESLEDVIPALVVMHHTLLKESAEESKNEFEEVRSKFNQSLLSNIQKAMEEPLSQFSDKDSHIPLMATGDSAESKVIEVNVAETPATLMEMPQRPSVASILSERMRSPDQVVVADPVGAPDEQGFSSSREKASLQDDVDSGVKKSVDTPSDSKDQNPSTNDKESPVSAVMRMSWGA